MAFYDELQQKKEWVKAEHKSVDRALIEYILHKRKLTLADFWALISQEAEPYLELIAGKRETLPGPEHDPDEPPHPEAVRRLSGGLSGCG